MSDKKTCLRIKGQPIEVTQEVYDLYTKSERKMRYLEEDLKRERLIEDTRGNIVIVPSREDSLERLTDENAQQFAEDTPSVEDLVIRKMGIETLHSALLQLPQQDFDLIHVLFFENLTELEYARRIGVSRQTIHSRKKVIMNKLKTFCEK